MKNFMCRLLLCVVLLASAADALAEWTQQFPDPHPTARGYHAMAYIGGDQVLLFGGLGDNKYNDTWLYDLSEGAWTLLDPPTKPMARSYHDMAYIGGDQVLMFGGHDGNGYDQTWVYDLSQGDWTDMNPPTAPIGRYGHGMSYIGGDKALLFCGYTYDPSVPGHWLDDTWVYDFSANTWTEIFPPNIPTVRAYFKLAYMGGDQVVMFGGGGAATWWWDDTWVFDLSEGTWTELSPIVSPPGRHWHAMVSMGDDQALMFGGDAYPKGLTDETWVYDFSDNTWTLLNPSVSPSPRREVVMADIGGDHVLLFGGRTETEDPRFYFDDTWVWNLEASPAADPSAANLPENFSLSQNYPNPFNAGTQIAYEIPKDVYVTLRVYNVLGSEVATLVDAYKEAGFYTARWDARDVASGVYFYNIWAGDFKATKKMVMLK
jgi:N-acetylneuraminic acid mutarotase